MKIIYTLMLVVMVTSSAFAGGMAVKYEVDGEAFEGYYSSPSDGAPLVFLVHDWDGLTDYEVKRAQMLSDLGYAVFAVDMFGEGVSPAEVAERRALTGALYQDRERMRKLLYGALEAAKKAGAATDNAVAMGYCFGGTVVLEFARSGADMKGFVTFHGGLATPEGQDYSGTKGEVLVLHGSADSAVPMEQFAALASELESAGIRHEMTTYSGAPHAFTVFGSDRYREDADKKSWISFTSFLHEMLK